MSAKDWLANGNVIRKVGRTFTSFFIPNLHCVFLYCATSVTMGKHLESSMLYVGCTRERMGGSALL